MNDPNRKIEIDKSSLLSLKAELLRKQEEVGRAKASSSIEDFVPKKAPKAEKDVSEKRKERREKKEKPQPTVTELEDSAQLARSKRMLEVKSKYYDRMVASGGTVNSDENSLVMFNKKKQDTKSSYTLTEESPSESSSSSSSDENERDEDNESPWVEYTDCLGRTRKCLKEDLATCLERDKELAKTMAPREGQRREDFDGSSKVAATPAIRSDENDKVNVSDENDDAEEGEIVGPMPPSMAMPDPDIGERFRVMREQWVEQEEANLEKDSIHYQDILFDEARLHGVGYYAFSTDQQERSRQRDELDTIRESTMEAQKEREALRKARDKLISDRVKAARARQRARQGLPPEEEPEDDAKTGESSDQLYDQEEERRKKKAEEKLRKKREREERRRERERAEHVRPWDEGKEQNAEDKEWVPAKERFVLSQHEWNDLKRGERIEEFAPPSMERSSGNASAYGARTWTQPARGPLAGRSPPARSDSESSTSSDDEETAIGPMPVEVPPEAPIEDIPLPEEDPNTRALFFTTKKNAPKKELKRRNLNAVEMVIPAKQTAPVPIRNELSEPEDSADTTQHQQQQPRRTGAEIEPPATYDYYGPTGVAAGRQTSYPSRVPPETKSNLQASIEAGLKFLRNQSDKAGGPGTKNRWTSNADY